MVNRSTVFDEGNILDEIARAGETLDPEEEPSAPIVQSDINVYGRLGKVNYNCYIIFFSEFKQAFTCRIIYFFRGDFSFFFLSYHTHYCFCLFYFTLFYFNGCRLIILFLYLSLFFFNLLLIYC